MILKFIKEYWTQILFLISIFTTLYKILKSTIEATKCTLRNDILIIYEKCKPTNQITRYQLESINNSAELYFQLKGNSFVKEIVEIVKEFDLID